MVVDEDYMKTAAAYHESCMGDREMYWGAYLETGFNEAEAELLGLLVQEGIPLCIGEAIKENSPALNGITHGLYSALANRVAKQDAPAPPCYKPLAALMASDPPREGIEKFQDASGFRGTTFYSPLALLSPAAAGDWAGSEGAVVCFESRPSDSGLRAAAIAGL